MSSDSISKTDSLAPIIDPALRYYGLPAPQAEVEFGAATHVGLVRSNNEDHYAVVQRQRSRHVLLTNVPRELLVANQDVAYSMLVADGMGGAACGELASRLALTTAWELGGREARWLQTMAEMDEDIEEQLQIFGSLLSAALKQRSQAEPATAGMGTTLTIVYTVGNHAIVAHVGDSRAYLIRENEIYRLTNDHTLAEEMLASGASEAQVARFHHVLTNCLTSEGAPVEVEFRRVALASRDWILLCTDGLSDLVSDAEIVDEIRQATQPQQACDGLIQRALARGGRDNVTVVAGRYLFH